MDRREYFRRWSQLHGGVAVESSFLIRFWLGLTYVVARPLLRLGFTPNALTLLGVVCSLAVAALAAGQWLWLAAVVAIVASFLDNLDGAVAILSGRSTKRGYVLDSVADRISDCALFAALWLAGAPGPAVVAAAFLAFVQEYLRARSAAAGVSEVGVVSISERPTRLIIVIVFLALAAWAPYGISAAQWACWGALLACVVGVIGLIQVALVLRRRLRQLEQSESKG